MLRCVLDENGNLIAAITIVRQHRMAEQKEVNMYDYSIVQKLPDDEQRLFVGEISHAHADGALVLLKKVLDQESWLVIEEEEEEVEDV